MLNSKRAFALAVLPAVIFVAGCASPEPQPSRTGGTYCYKGGRDPRPVYTCTPGQVPSLASDSNAKTLEGTKGALTVYVLRHGWSDESTVVSFSVNGAAAVHTVPRSLVRVQLAPGTHRLSTQWEGQTFDISVEGGDGDVRTLKLERFSAVWGTTVGWSTVSRDEMRSKVQPARLVADLDARR